MRTLVFLGFERAFAFGVLLVIAVGCSNSTGSPSTQVDTGGGIPVCTRDQDCTSMQVGPCTRGVCSLQTHQCMRELVPDKTACDDNNICTDNDQCDSGSCKGVAVTCQKPADSCQSVACQPENGCVVTNRLDGSKCDDNDPCTDKDTCRSGHCQGLAKSCDDGLKCTADVCDNGLCTHDLIAGYCKINEKCIQDNASNPDTACEVCDVKASASEWQRLKDGTKVDDTAICYHGEVCNPVVNCRDMDCGDDNCGGVCGKCGNHYQCESGKCVFQAYCGDGNCDAAKNENCASCPDDCACKAGDVCYPDQCCTPACTGRDCGDDGCGGSCWKGQGTECSDALDCTSDQCTSNKCSHSLQSGYCLIDQKCYAENQQKPGDVCQECITVKDTTGWSSADDGTLCQDASGKCIDGACCVPACMGRECGDNGCGGSCWTGGANTECDDGLSCTTDKCSEDGRCSHEVLSDYCLINNKCYKNNANNPENTCKYCLASKKHDNWSVRPDEFDLGNGKVCFQGLTCDHAGNCANKECGDDQCGADCGTCKSSYICNAGQKCEYQASCGNGKCDRLSEDCGTCPADCGCKTKEVCFQGACCVPKCANRECGNNGCGGVCGSCDFVGACDEATGKCMGRDVWSYNLGLPVYYTPAIDNNGILYLGTGCAKDGTGDDCADDGPAKLIALDPTKGDNPVVWSINMDTAIRGAVSIGKNGWIYFGDNKGNVHAYKPNGAQAWQYAFGTGSHIYASVGLSDTEVFAVDTSGVAMALACSDGSVNVSPGYFGAGPYNDVTIAFDGKFELFGTKNGRFRWLKINQNGYNDSTSYVYVLGNKNISEISMASLGFLKYVACMTSPDQGGQYCYALYGKTPDCHSIGGVPYDSVSGIALDMVPGKDNAAYGYLIASKWTSTSAQNGTYLHRVLIQDASHTGDKVLAHVPGISWETPVLLSNGQVLFNAGGCLYDFKVNNNSAVQLWSICVNGGSFQQLNRFDTSPLPGKLNGEDVVFVLTSFIGINYEIHAIRTLNPIRQAPWPYPHHDIKNTGNFKDNKGTLPW